MGLVYVVGKQTFHHYVHHDALAKHQQELQSLTRDTIENGKRLVLNCRRLNKRVNFFRKPRIRTDWHDQWMLYTEQRLSSISLPFQHSKGPPNDPAGVDVDNLVEKYTYERSITNTVKHRH